MMTSSTSQGRMMKNRWAGARCLRCDCVMRRGMDIVWAYGVGASHVPGQCPPASDRPAWQDWYQALSIERHELQRVPDPKPLRVVLRLADIEDEIAAGYRPVPL